MQLDDRINCDFINSVISLDLLLLYTPLCLVDVCYYSVVTLSCNVFPPIPRDYFLAKDTFLC